MAATRRNAASARCSTDKVSWTAGPPAPVRAVKTHSTATSGRAVAHLKHADGTQDTCAAAYIAGCDGTHSRVREALRIGFPGGTSDHVDIFKSAPELPR